MAARGRVPIVATGTGFSLPPATLECFPPLDEHFGEAGVNDEEVLLKIVNRAAERTGPCALRAAAGNCGRGCGPPRCSRSSILYGLARGSRSRRFSAHRRRQPKRLAAKSSSISTRPCRRTRPRSRRFASWPGKNTKCGPTRRNSIPTPRPGCARAPACGWPSPCRWPTSCSGRGSRSPMADWGSGIGARLRRLPLAVLPTDLEKMLNGRALERIEHRRSITLKENGQQKSAAEIAAAIAAAADDDALSQRAERLP